MFAIRAVLPICLALLSSEPGEAARSAWKSVGEAQVRLLGFREPGSTTVTAGVEIAMTPGWHTYWRNPGEAGIPPQFDFSASENVASVVTDYPAPERYHDGTSLSLVYHDQVVFPLRIKPQDASRPVRLRVSARFGVCNDICIPVMTATELDIPPDASNDPLAEALLAQAAERVPGPPLPREFEISATVPSPDMLAITVTVPESHRSDLFVEGPPEWLVGQPEFVSRDGFVLHYRLSLKGRPAGASVSGQLFRFVAVAGARAIEDVVRIP